MLDPGCGCCCVLILPSRSMVTELRDSNDHFADGTAGFHVGDGLGRGFQRKDLVHDRLDDTLIHQRAYSLELLAARVREQVLETHALFPRQAIDLAIQEPEQPDQRQAEAPAPSELEIGRASCREKCRTRGSPEHEKKNTNDTDDK